MNMVHILGQKKSEFVIGSICKTTPQYDDKIGPHKEGEICEINNGLITFYSGGGKETLSEDWLIPA
jgi:hypothetical protein